MCVYRTLDFYICRVFAKPVALENYISLSTEIKKYTWRHEQLVGTQQFS